MPTPSHNRLLVVSITLAVSMSTLMGCSNSPTTSLPPPSAPVANPSADNQLQDVTVENESANMDRIKKAGAGR